MPDARFPIQRFSCALAGQYAFNTPVSLPAGVYVFGFGGFQFQGVKVEAGRETLLKLRKIFVPRSTTPMRFRVFEDISYPHEYDKQLLSARVLLPPKIGASVGVRLVMIRSALRSSPRKVCPML